MSLKVGFLVLFIRDRAECRPCIVHLLRGHQAVWMEHTIYNRSAAHLTELFSLQACKISPPLYSVVWNKKCNCCGEEFLWMK